MTHNLNKLYSMLDQLLNKESEYTLEMYNSRDGSDRYYFYAQRKDENRVNLKNIKSQIRELEYQKGLV